MSKKLERNSDLPFQKIVDDLLIVSPKERRVHRLNDVAAHIWTALEKPLSLSELTRSVTEEFEVDQETAKKDVSEFVDELKKNGLLT